MEWEPWTIADKGPPCKFCKFWRPEFLYMVLQGNGMEISDGIKLCHASEQQYDFSCYRKKEPVNVS